MRPGTFFEFDDQSQIPELPIEQVPDAPVYCCLSTTEKGPEEWTLLQGKDWFNAYGNDISYANHGQPLLQTAVSVNAGAKILFKRLVADDALLANTAIFGKIVSNMVQKVIVPDEDETAEPIPVYEDGKGNETTDPYRKNDSGEYIYKDALTGAETTDEQCKQDGKPMYTDRNGDPTEKEQKTDENGQSLYVDENGVETTNDQRIDSKGNKLYTDDQGHIHTQDSAANEWTKEIKTDVNTYLIFAKSHVLCFIFQDPDTKVLLTKQQVKDLNLDVSKFKVTIQNVAGNDEAVTSVDPAACDDTNEDKIFKIDGHDSDHPSIVIIGSQEYNKLGKDNEYAKETTHYLDKYNPYSAGGNAEFGLVLIHTNHEFKDTDDNGKTVKGYYNDYKAPTYEEDGTIKYNCKKYTDYGFTYTDSCDIENPDRTKIIETTESTVPEEIKDIKYNAVKNEIAKNDPLMNERFANKPIMIIGSQQVQYTAKTVENCTSIAEIKKALLGTADDEPTVETEEGAYLLWVIYDNGRGVSNKRFKIVPNYRLSKNLDYMLYQFSTIENGVTLESMFFTPDPDRVRNMENISLETVINTYSTQLRCYQNEQGLRDFIYAIQEAGEIDHDTTENYDYLFCRTRKDRPLTTVTLDTENGLDLQNNFGQSLVGGDNGSFGTRPWYDHRDLYNGQMIRALDGTYSKVIFDVDRFYIDCFLDANYDPIVKRAIEALAIYREDFMYFRDMGTDLQSFDEIEYMNMDNASTMFAATYCTAYDVMDPYSKKRVNVTVTYDIAQFLVPHLAGGYNLPPAGILHGFVLNPLPGTVNYVPIVYPEVDEKDEMNDIRVNYASYIENDLVIETLYTSQEAYTQFSFVNNVMAIQKVVKAIRKRCPVIRYSFIDGEDLDIYKNDINMVLDRFRSQFRTLQMEYVADPVYVANKVFYATIKVIFRDFVQTEWFKITALNEFTNLNG